MRGGALQAGPVELPTYDPAARKYVTVRAAAIPIKVIGDPAVASAQGLMPSPDNVIGRDIRPNREVPRASGRLVARTFEGRWLLFLVLTPALAYVLVVVADKTRERLRRETPRARLRRLDGRSRIFW